jgi:hypothetical protein
MRRIINNFMMILIVFSIWNNGFGQSKKELVNQKPVVAGQFYPADSVKLKNTLMGFFTKAKPASQGEEVLAIISPHAGYVYSGQVAASAFNQVDPRKEYKTVFVIGSSHKMHYKGAAIYNKGNFITPLGTVKVNMSLADEIISKNPIFNSNSEPFSSEHSIEVQLPFLQYHLKKDFRIIPILIGSQDVADSKKIAQALLPWFNNENLFVFSTDFSHYPDYATATAVDKQTADAIISASPEEFIKTLNTHTKKNIPNLLTSACAWPSVLSLIYMTEVTTGAEIHLIDYMNSGDTEYGDKQRVVGYNALSVSVKKQTVGQTDDFSINESDKKILLEIARNSIEYYLTNNKFSTIKNEGFSKTLESRAGAFVTLELNGNLRGCIGRMVGSDTPLYKVVQEMAVSAAVNDHRFEKVSLSEMKNIEIEISVLTPLKLIRSIEEIELGKNGIYIKKGSQSGTFLPQVAEETGWSREEFLGHCARDKAGIGWDGWKEADIYTYEAIVFGEKEIHK